MSLLGGLLDNVVGLVREWVPDTDKQKQIEASVKLAFMQHEETMAGELTKRHVADMQSDSKLSKNIRPAMWIASGVNLVVWYGIDTFFAPVDPKILEGSFWAFSAISGLYVTAREVGKGVINFGAKK